MLSSVHAAAVLAFVAALLICSSSQATVIVDNTFNSGLITNPPIALTAPYSTTYSENGVDQDGSGDITSLWTVNNNGGSTTPSVGHMVSAMNTNGTSSYQMTTYFTAPGTAVVLANPGDQMVLTWVFTPTGVVAQNTSQAFDVAVVDSPVRVATINNSLPTTGYAGYAIFGNMGTTLGASNSFALKEAIANPTDLMSTSGNWGANGVSGTLTNDPNATTGKTGYASGTQYTMTWTLTRGMSNDLMVDVKMVGGSIGGTGTVEDTYDDTSPNSFTYDTFSFRPNKGSTTATSFDTTLFEVQGPLVNVPEPGSLILLGLGAGALGLITLGRRKVAE
ncbi:MAG TPA: PEP-CTERM sorting domain-containing protein [Pirellulales bacterium]|nr:PEP-CTERM sorting domain-containing protein [Pirellulales bacterium]